ncbi:zinc-binding dehydrogenase [Leisingera sp. SS27]|uniref:zinc-binding dehydrogenase n=1 Tax=Leisingera sp. SS27 TaxID=2979462 RepID=UPI00232D754C|nr:zinc-binding dehydrogenase [Leisingera sp. SS27]MDC0657766.1 zinc-binding dehydrogenase [Leisingera sp. SS27]
MAEILAPLLGFKLATPGAQQVDGAIDVRGRNHAQQAFAALKDCGTYATIVPEWRKPGGILTAARGITPVTVQNPANQQVLLPLADWLARGILDPGIEEIMPLDRIAKAHRRSEAPGHSGKFVLDQIC